MADSVWGEPVGVAEDAGRVQPRHAALVRVTHWITAAAFLALLVTGIGITISHPRFYWGETGNVHMKPLFQIPIPASRASVPTGYKFTMPDFNGWGRYLHFQSAWAAVLTGAVYLVWGFFSGHFRRNLLPAPGTFSWSAIGEVIRHHLGAGDTANPGRYNVLQRITYLTVVFVFFPLVVWTPAIASVWPVLVSSLGGQQSARTIHFFDSILLTIFLVVHVVLVVRSGFRNRMREMITGNTTPGKERP